LKFNPKLSWEFLSADEIASKTVRALRNQIKHVKEVSPYYQETLWDIAPEDLKSIDDFNRLPFTGRTALADHTQKFVSVNPVEVVETVATGGATGKPVFCSLTLNDLDRLAFSEALSFHSVGLTDEDRVLLFVGFDRWALAGIGYYRGLSLIGANTGRAGVVSHDLCRQYIEAFKPTAVIGTPSFLRRLAVDMAKSGFDPKGRSVTKLICVGESLKNQSMAMNSIGVKLQEQWGAKAYVSYTITELADSFCECTEQQGGHTHPELLYPEIIDDKGQPAADGVPGELVATSLGIEGMPLVRYRTGDVTFKVSGACPCGRNSVRIGPILGRTSEMIKARGAVVFPLTITNALDELDEINDYVIIIESDDGQNDRVSVHVAAQPSLVERIAGHLRAAVNISFPILISNISTIQSMRGGARRHVRIVDWRQQAHRRS
jgi:phenylacetate-CoA ligase